VTPTKLVYRVRQLPKVDPAWGAIVGDALHNMRSALDHLALQLVILDGGNPSEYTQFPIYDSPTNDKGNPRFVTIQPRIQDARIRAALEKVQPYQYATPAETELSVISALNNYDKHRLLLTVAGVLDVDANPPSYSLAEGVAAPEIRINLAPLGDGAPVAWFDFQGAPAPPDFEPHIFLAFTLREGPVPWMRHRAVPELLEGLLYSMTWLVINERFLPFFAGERPIDYMVAREYR
jgi:hypothetical protein